MTWWAIDVRPEPSRRDQVGAWLVARTGHAVEEREDGTLVTFAEDEHAAEALIAALASAEDAPLETARRPLESVDWSTRWREGLGPRRVGRLTVVPSWFESPETLRSARGRARSRDRVRQRRAWLHPSGPHAARTPPATRRPGARPGKRERDSRDRRGEARRRERRGDRERSGGRTRSPGGTPSGTMSAARCSSSKATLATSPRCSAPLTCCCPTFSAR